ncbi:uncharacterized protein LOC129595895 isoform X2 [Paramacrobiotus metropolitanus]|nr:uncharacterized protein LOC129595895 isoform X2 [Paramacrobiotus metropolitanus]XP_055349008.1 uncharacterized protein LOC129595895 isoform X2 [Paramacrobiotus metropolitanus]
MTDEYLDSHRSDAERLCRASNETGQCLRDVLSRCSNAKAPNVWLLAEFLIAISALCQQPRGSLPFYRAMDACTRKEFPFIDYLARRVLESDLSDQHLSLNATMAHHLLCRFFQLTESSFNVNGTLRTELVQRCGNEGMLHALVDGTKTLHSLHCSLD